MSSLGGLATVHQQKGSKSWDSGRFRNEDEQRKPAGAGTYTFQQHLPAKKNKKKKNETNGYGNVSFLILNSWSLCEDGQPAQMYIPSPYLALVSAATVVASCSD